MMPMNPAECCQLPRHAKEAEVVEECFKTWEDQTKRERAQKDAGERGCVSDLYDPSDQDSLF